MIILPNMGLVKWDSINDFFSHEQLAANFAALDAHDHTLGKGKQIPLGGLAEQSVGPDNLTEEVYTQFGEHLGPESILTANIKDGAINSAKILNGTVKDEDLLSPNNSTYRQLLRTTGTLVNDATAGGYMIGSEKAWASGSASSELSFPYIYFDDADYKVEGKTQKLRIRAQVASNATKATIKFTFGLYPFTVAGAADNLTLTLGTVVAGSTVAINEPAASSITSGVGSDFEVPVDGAYLLGVETSGTLTNNSRVMLSSQLQTHSV